MTSEPDWATIWTLAAQAFALGDYSLHGPDHWRRVEQNGLHLCQTTGANPILVRLFAVLHDAKRQNECRDPQHGQRAADWAASLRGRHFQLNDADFDALSYACIWHDKGLTSLDATIGMCWDADRLDLPRVAITPVERLMSTATGKAMTRRPKF
jgi:uncharacterized protein